MSVSYIASLSSSWTTGLLFVKVGVLVFGTSEVLFSPWMHSVTRIGFFVVEWKNSAFPAAGLVSLFAQRKNLLANLLGNY
jgi:hypothetical protein